MSNNVWPPTRNETSQQRDNLPRGKSSKKQPQKWNKTSPQWKKTAEDCNSKKK
jgi:hypothetical protein